MKASKSIAFSACLLMAGSGAAHVTAAPGKPTPIMVVISGLGCSTALGAGSFEARSWSWGATAATTSGGSGEGTGKPVPAPLMLTRVSDACSPALLGALMHGDRFTKLTLSHYDTVGVLKATVVLEDVILTEWQIGGSDTSAEPTEELSVSFRKFTFGDVSNGNNFCYDIAQQKAC